MRDQALTLPVLYLRHIADQVRSLGGDVDQWLAGSGLRPSQLDDPACTLSLPVFQRLVRDALRLSREPALGLLVGERLGVTAHGILGYGAVHGGTLRETLGLVERYAGLRISLLTIGHEVHRGDVRIVFSETHPLGDVRRPLLEAAVLSIKNVLDDISMGACRVGAVAFPFAAPPYADLARDLFGAPVRWSQSWAGFTLPVGALDLALKTADPEAFREAAAICQRELDKLTANESTAARVRRLLLEKQHGFPSLQVTARRFAMTPRTLHRRLVDEGTSYRALLEGVRHTLAVEHLEAGRFTVDEIAYTLGYSDLANFRRAFKRWESVAPSEYRARHAAGR